MLAGLVVVIALVTGGGIVKALPIAVAFFVLATAWSWWRFRTRIDEQERR